MEKPHVEDLKLGKTVQIPSALFLQLAAHHLYGMDYSSQIRAGLTAKIDQLAARELYSRSKDKNLPEAEREEARQAYLDAAGIRPDWQY